MDADPAACPHCDKVIEPRPRRNRKCPHCREPIVLRQGALLTPAGAQAHDDKQKAPKVEAPPPAPPADEVPRVAHVKMFRTSLTPWQSLFAEAAEFVTEVGPERLIGVSHSADGGEGVVAVWYWETPEWGGVGATDQDTAAEPG
jgi:hypothetical protein